MLINWKQKLSSRKFWVAVTGFVTTLFIALGIDEITTEQTVAVLGSVAVLISYILGEGYVDANK